VITLAWPWLLLVLPLPLLARRLLPAAEPASGDALRLPFFAALRAGSGGRRSGVHWLLPALCWVLLVLAAARPEWVGEPVQLPLAGRDLMLAVDISGSMEQEDYRLNGRPVSRLEVVKAVAGRFIERRVGDRIGLILFGSRAYLQTPITYDRATVAALLSQSVIGLAGRETAIGDAIGLAIKRLREQPEANRVLILLTDGRNTAGNIAPLDAAGLAADEGVRIYTIGIGAGEVGSNSPFGMLMRRGSDLDPRTLRELADFTGGRYFQATATADLERIYQELDRLEPNLRESRSFRPRLSLYYWPAGMALVLSLLVALLKLSTARRRRVVAGGTADVG